MLRSALSTLILLTLCDTASAQALFIANGERAAEGSLSWSVGPSSNGIETQGAASLDGRWEVGFGFNRYTMDVGGFDSSFTEWTPFVRYFLFKETDDSTPVSLAGHAQYFSDNFEGDDSGWYVLAGASMYKRLVLTDAFALYPYVGFSLAGESFTFGGGPAERALYITRLFGVHGQLTVVEGTWIRISVEEHSFRRETFRALRAAFVKRF